MKTMIKKIILARKIFKKAFEENENFRMGYEANIAMLLYDKYGITGVKERHNAAIDIISVIFDAKDFKKKKELKVNSNRFEILDIR